jgi:ferredoxin
MNDCWKVTVNRDTCIGSGICAGTAPRYFRLDNNRSRAITDTVKSDDDALAAAESCPTESITIHDAAGHQLAPPTTLLPLPGS